MGHKLPELRLSRRLGRELQASVTSATLEKKHRLVIESPELFDLFFLSLPIRWPDITVRRPAAMNTYELLVFSSVLLLLWSFYFVV